MVSHTIYPDKDARLEESNPTTNYGSSTYISVAQIDATNGIWRSVIEFDISAIIDVPIAFISSCTLNVYDSGSTDPRTIDFRRIDNGTWTESGVTWNNQPSSTDYNLEDNWSTGWNSRSIISILRDALRDGHSYVGILMKYTNESYDGSLDINQLRSKESSYDPYLSIAYSTYSQTVTHSSVRCESLDAVMDGWGHITLTDWNLAFTQGEFTFKTEWGTTDTGVILNEGETEVYTSGIKHHTFKLINVYDNGPCDNLVDASFEEKYWEDDCYVKTTGDNDRNGTDWTEAWSTVDQAANEAFDGQEVHIGFGTYNSEPASNDITPVNFGTTGIKYTPETAGTGGGTGTVTVERN